MEIILCITKEDISTFKIGEHYSIKSTRGIQINFTKDAILELYNDMLDADKMDQPNQEVKDQEERAKKCLQQISEIEKESGL